MAKAIDEIGRFAGRGTPAALLAGYVVACFLILFLVYDISLHRATDGLRKDAQLSAYLRVLALESELQKQRSIPDILAEDRDVRDALMSPRDAARAAAICGKLQRVQASTHSSVIYVIGRDGKAMAASNWNSPASFVGKDFGFRSYFKNALSRGDAEEFALGVVSHEPGLYLAHRVASDGPAPGVVVVKVEFDAMEAAWARSGEAAFVTDAANRVLITDRPASRFQAGPTPAREQIETAMPVTGENWTLRLLTSRKAAWDAARNVTLMAAMVEGTALVLLIVWWRRHQHTRERAEAEQTYRKRLEASVAERTQELTVTNDRLRNEIDEHNRTNQRLSVLQADLIQANKLAALGQIMAGVAHEMNQPLATVSILAENARAVVKGSGVSPAASLPAASLAQLELVASNLTGILEMSERMGQITGQLRTFSRKATGHVAPIVLRDAVSSSILLNKSRLRKNRVRLSCANVDPAIIVMAERVRLEQILVNLLQNAFEALDDRRDPRVFVEIDTDPEWVTLHIRDNGPGLGPDIARSLFVPFSTSKDHGLGLGLVISRDIAREFGGDLTAASSDAGACFSLRLCRSPL